MVNVVANSINDTIVVSKSKQKETTSMEDGATKGCNNNG